MSRDYVPRADGRCLAWLLGLSANISQHWSAYGMSQPDAANLAARVADFQAAAQVAANEATRTKAKVLAKDEYRAIAVNLARVMCQQIKLNQGVSDEMKQQAGIPVPRPPGFRRLPAPGSRPTLAITGNVNLMQTVAFADSDGPSRRGRPPGSKALYLFVAVGDGPSGDPTKAVLVDGFSRGPVCVTFKPADKGRTATYWACWVSPTMARGPLSNPVSQLIAA